MSDFIALGQSTSPSPVRITWCRPRADAATWLCRPYRDGGGFASPASNKEIAAEVSLGIDAVKSHLRILYQRSAIAGLPQQQKRIRLAEMQLGLDNELERR